MINMGNDIKSGKSEKYMHETLPQFCVGSWFFLLFLLLVTVNNLYTFKYIYMEDISHIQMLNNYLVQLEKYYSKSK